MFDFDFLYCAVARPIFDIIYLFRNGRGSIYGQNFLGLWQFGVILMRCDLIERMEIVSYIWIKWWHFCEMNSLIFCYIRFIVSSFCLRLAFYFVRLNFFLTLSLVFLYVYWFFNSILDYTPQKHKNRCVSSIKKFIKWCSADSHFLLLEIRQISQ